MDVSLNQLQSECSSTEYKNAIKLLIIYIRNIYQNPSVEKYRKIRIGNEKFHANVWKHETCRTILLLAGFEEVGEFLVLSNNADVSVLYKSLEGQMSLVEPNSEGTSPTKPAQAKVAPTLSLASGSQGGGIFVNDMKADLTLLSYMVEMGYSKHVAEKGLLATKNQGVQPAMDWIAEHPECHFVEKEQNVPIIQESTSSTSSSTPQSSSSSENVAVKSRLRNSNEQKHAYQEKLRLEAIKKAKVEKAEDKIAKKYLMKNLQSEREENKEKFEREKIIRHVENDDQGKLSTDNSSAPVDVNICALRIRMHDGKTLMWETAKDTNIKKLYSHVTSLLNDPNAEFHVCVPHPHEVLDQGDESSLFDKGLYPKATVVVQMLKQNVPDVQESTASSEYDSALETDGGIGTSTEEMTTDLSAVSSESVAMEVSITDAAPGEHGEPVGD